MNWIKQTLMVFGGTALAGLLLATANPAMGQPDGAYDPTDWYGGYDDYRDDYDDVNDFFYDDTIYDPNDYGYDDNYYERDYMGPFDDDDLTGAYNSWYNPGAGLGYAPVRDGRYGYPRYRSFYEREGGAHFYGGNRYYGQHRLYDGADGLYERPYGYNNYYYDDSNLGTLGDDYFTNDWYDQGVGFDDWY